MEDDGFALGQRAFFLCSTNLWQQPVNQGLEHRICEPLQPRAIAQEFLKHEAMELRIVDREFKQGLVHPFHVVCGTDSGRLRQIGVPLVTNMFEDVFGYLLPKNVFRTVVVGDERVLQSDPVRDTAYARSLKALRGEFRKRGIQDGGTRLLRTLLLRTPKLCRTSLSGSVLAGNCTLHHMVLE